MPRYDFSCPNCGTFEDTCPAGVPDEKLFCQCGAKVARLVSLPTAVVTKDGFEENNAKALRPELLHQARMQNKRSVERDWHKVESGECSYSPGKAPEMYQPRQHLERERKKVY